MKRQYAELQKSEKEQLNMAKAQEEAATTSKLPGCQGKEGGGTLSRLWEELADAQGKLSEYQKQLKVNTRRRRELVREKMDLQTEMYILRDKLRESEDMCIQIRQLKKTWESRQHVAFHTRLYNLVRRVLGMVWGFMELE
ncbi:hypothetical protein AAFF_G00395230 [Aldrovandia affinis]|uniref:Uncharacterized protein n=1 Tax=Aldrovandia affinis TaxID=143900 RepID=A0AAD7WLS9_9TELE|nr:hypothetical protein AAFF_G00395230 [Aldrovandia affinis]